MLSNIFSKWQILSPQAIYQSFVSIGQWLADIWPFGTKEDLTIPESANNDAVIQALNDDLYDSGFAYDSKQDIFYSIFNPWQREFGYCELYDEAAAPLSMIIDCEPIRFEYDNKKWLIELWKGQYGMTTGGEIGIYTSSDLELNIPGLFQGLFYKSATDEDLLPMSFTLRRKNIPILSRSDRHWWLTGFKLGEFSEPEELTMDVSIEFKDWNMTKAFIHALQELGYLSFHIVVHGNTVSFTYVQPYSPQPSTRGFPLEWMAQQRNEDFCNVFQYLTKGLGSAIDKLIYLQGKFPDLYQQVFKIGKSEQLYESFDLIQKFLQ